MWICNRMIQLFVAFTLVLQKMWFGHVDAGEEHSLRSQVPFLQSGAALLHQIQRVLQVSQAGCSLESRSVCCFCKHQYVGCSIWSGMSWQVHSREGWWQQWLQIPPEGLSQHLPQWMGEFLVSLWLLSIFVLVIPASPLLLHTEKLLVSLIEVVTCCAVLTHDVLFVQLEKWNEQRESGTWPGRYWASTLDFLKRVTFLCPDVVCVFLFLTLSAGSLMQVSLPQVETACAIRLEFMTSGQVMPFSWVWLYRVQHSSCASLRCRNRPLSQTVWFSPNLGSCAYCIQFSVHD